MSYVSGTCGEYTIPLDNITIISNWTIYKYIMSITPGQAEYEKREAERQIELDRRRAVQLQINCALSKRGRSPYGPRR